MICPKCGYDAEKHRFCPECGEQIIVPDAESSMIDIVNEENPMEETQDTDFEKIKFTENKQMKYVNKKKIVMAGATILVAVITIVIALTGGFKSHSEKIAACMQKGNYSRAYKLSKSDEEKTEVTAENAIACCYYYLVKEQELGTHTLKNAWFNTTDWKVVLKIESNKTTYVLYKLEETFYGTDYFFSYITYDLDENKKFNSGDPTKDAADILWNSVNVSYINDTIANGYSLSETQINRILKSSKAPKLLDIVKKED